MDGEGGDVDPPPDDKFDIEKELNRLRALAVNSRNAYNNLIGRGILYEETEYQSRLDEYHRCVDALETHVTNHLGNFKKLRIYLDI